MLVWRVEKEEIVSDELAPPCFTRVLQQHIFIVIFLTVKISLFSFPWNMIRYLWIFLLAGKFFDCLSQLTDCIYSSIPIHCIYFLFLIHNIKDYCAERQMLRKFVVWFDSSIICWKLGILYEYTHTHSLLLTYRIFLKTDNDGLLLISSQALWENPSLLLFKYASLVRSEICEYFKK
jgi:hypothetical protein